MKEVWKCRKPRYLEFAWLQGADDSAFMNGSLSHRVSRHPAVPITARHILCSTTPPGVPQREHRAGNGTQLGDGAPGNTVSHVGMGSGFTSTAWVGGKIDMAQS